MTAYQFALMLAAPIAAALTILGVIVVRGTKITEFRQAWINAQRDDLAGVVANARRLMRGLADDKPHEAWATFDLALTRIRLRRNPHVRLTRRLFAANRVEWHDVFPALDRLERALTTVPIDRGAARDAIDKIVSLSPRHLKREWNRTRDGELGFKLTIVLAPVLIGGPLLAAAGWLLDRILGLHLVQGVPFTATLPLSPG